MANVFIEPQPSGSTAPIIGYRAELAGGTSIDGKTHRTQQWAIDAAKAANHHPLVARVRVTNKGNPDHWRDA